MTVAVGLKCRDGVLVASDSMGSDESIAMHAEKVRVFGRIPAVWTMSGSVYVAEEVTAELKLLDSQGSAEKPLAIFTSPQPALIRDKVASHVRKGMNKAYGGAVSSTPFPGGSFPTNFAATFLVLGFSEGIGWFLEVAPDGQLNWHDSHRFYATGSGGPFATVAMGLMQHFITDDLTLEMAKLIAYRTIDTTIRISSRSVGPPVQIAICDSAGPRILDDDEIDALKTAVQRWTALEVDTLRELFSSQTPDEGAASMPAIDDVVS